MSSSARRPDSLFWGGCQETASIILSSAPSPTMDEMNVQGEKKVLGAKDGVNLTMNASRTFSSSHSTSSPVCYCGMLRDRKSVV